MSPRIAAIADALLEAHHAGLPLAGRGEGPSSVAEAYRVQEEVLDRLGFGARPVAWKVGPPAQPGGDMLASPVFAAPLRSPATIAAGSRAILGIEAEIAFRFAAPPPRGATVADVRAAVDEMLVLIELCETRIAGWAEAPALWKLADFQSHGAFVVGSGTRELARDFSAQRMELEIGGRAGASAVGSHPTGRLWEMLAWAVEHCAGRGLPLQAGDVVTTGSWNGLAPLARGEEAMVRFPGIGEARLALS
jgi:2-keto-4-pentenoate hydratase